MNQQELKQIIEAVLFAASEPLNMTQLLSLFGEDDGPEQDTVLEAIRLIQQECDERSVELKQTGSGYRFQVKQRYAQWVTRLLEEKPARYSRATLETLALIAYRQPITRAEIEEVRGVSVSSSIIKSMAERDWVKVVGHRDVPGKPALYATTRGFLDYFNLSSLEDLPSLAELRDIDAINAELDLELPLEQQQTGDSDVQSPVVDEDSEIKADAESDADNEPQGVDASSSDGMDLEPEDIAVQAEEVEQQVDAAQVANSDMPRQSIDEDTEIKDETESENAAQGVDALTANGTDLDTQDHASQAEITDEASDTAQAETEQSNAGELPQEKEIADSQPVLSAEH